LITGGSSGIGRALVQAFAAQGDTVCFTYRSGRDRAQALIASLPGKPVQAFPLDLGDWQSVQALVAALPGPVDVLVNNAGLGSKTVEAYAPEAHAQDQALLQVNALGPLWLAQALLPGMESRGTGKIIQIASVGGGITQFPGFRLADGMSKAALAFMSRQLAAELIHSPVDVFTVCPGATETAMFEASTLGPMAPAAREAFVAGLPKGRLIRPEEIAEVVVFLASQGARVLHGAVIDASLGLGVRPGAAGGEA
jgi:NAD(P)-dependent dehydrogenase (short-subunit alcohol dehydrogenase family)